jgi:hypothetical protein
MSQDLFDRISDAGKAAYKEEVAARGERLVINKKWSDSTVNANASRSNPKGGMVVINMYGGLARRSEVDGRGFAIVLCHEMSHLYPVGPNYWDGAEDLQMGSEGEADYSATFKCYSKIAESVPELTEVGEFEPFIEENCKGDAVCQNALVGGKQLAHLLNALSRGGMIEFKDMAKNKVSQTISNGYPPVPCRLTSYVHGALQLGRPGCWKAATDPSVRW